MHYKGYYFAFEVQGGHYKKKQGNDTSHFYGKKKLKKEVLEAYGIITISVHCEETVPKTIMRFNKVNSARKFIMDLLEDNVSKADKIKK